MDQRRIATLDGFRFIAVTSVLFYHLSSPAVVGYPHTDFILHIFKYGYLGVNFFFVISGFVISYTLENTNNLLSFYQNRFARLFPAMLLCAVLTFAAMCLLDHEQQFPAAHELRNFLPSLTFTNPTLWTMVSHQQFHWINGSYWTLWVEVQFYFFCSAIFFAGKGKFFSNMLIAGILISVIKYIPNDLPNNYPAAVNGLGLNGFFNGWRKFDEIFNITFFIGWFVLGVCFHQLYKGFSFKKKPLITAGVIVVAACLVYDEKCFFPNFAVNMLVLWLICALFVAMIYRRPWLQFLENKYLVRIGVISYSIYLVHEVNGIFLIDKYSWLLGPLRSLSPFIVIVLVIGYAEISYRFYERKMASILKRQFAKWDKQHVKPPRENSNTEIKGP